MTTNELLYRVKERLDGTSSPALPPEETLSAILQLGKERDEAQAESKKNLTQIEELKSKIETLEMQKEELSYLHRQAEDATKEQEWIAHELGKFVSDVANGIYAGQERAAAQRVYDLNGGSVRKLRRNAYNYETVDGVKKAFLSVNKGQPYSIDELLAWMFRIADKP